MNELNFSNDYKNDEVLRKSFNELTSLVFSINFESWYKNGFWNERYIPFSYIDENRVVANVSVNVLELVIEGERKKALQIGTVMTHPDYRNKGLSARLMNRVFEEFENQYEFMYLFANESVLEFYPKFGFELVQEYQYSMDYTPNILNNTGIRKFDCTNAGDLDFIYKFASDRIPVSNSFGTENASSILMFHCMYVYIHDVYYLEAEDAIVIYKKQNRQIDLIDVISKKAVNIQDILSRIANKDTNKIVFHYTPDYKGIHTEKYIFNGSDALFLKANGNHQFPLQVKHPLTSQA